MSETSNGANPLDPFGFWKTMRDASLEAWSKSMIDAVNSDEYAQTTGLALEQVLATSQPYRDALQKSMTQTLAMMNMPSRAEITTLAERLVSLEMRLDDMDAKLSSMQKSILQAVKESAPSQTQSQTVAQPNLKEVEAKLDQLSATLAALVNVSSKTEPKPNGRRASAASNRASARSTTEKAQEERR